VRSDAAHLKMSVLDLSVNAFTRRFPGDLFGDGAWAATASNCTPVLLSTKVWASMGMIAPLAAEVAIERAQTNRRCRRSVMGRANEGVETRCG